MSRRIWKHRITDIIDSIKKIQKYVEKWNLMISRRTQKQSTMQSATSLSSVKRPRYVPDDVSTKYQNIPWRVMGDMRNFAVHEYWGVEMRTIWKTIQDDLPPLIPDLKRVVDVEKDEDEE